MSLAVNVMLTLLLFVSSTAFAYTPNGFELSNLTISQSEILPGGPGRDGIPAILEPKFVDGTQAHFMQDTDVVLGIEFSGMTKAYPIKILNWHEIVNDEIEGEQFMISYCPLCGSGMGFLAGFGEQKKTFGVSGLLYNSDVLMYDHQTESLWSQIRGSAVSGPLSGQNLIQYPLKLTRWSQWIEDHPNTKVLSTDTGFLRDYSHDPYAGYSDTPHLYFPISETTPTSYSIKETVLGLKGENRAIAFPFKELRLKGESNFKYEFEGATLSIHWDEENLSAWVTDEQGTLVSSTLLYWFAWHVFHPETEVYQH
ncbi:DUF3179 domain-containing protein [Vibrio astriarenae]|uniref:DUF3179 domain-containing protein n=1 Tax=Vibrio astriarenae TaxID=1481923 RepID=UPI0037350CBC